jgi:hypothetical protein
MIGFLNTSKHDAETRIEPTDKNDCDANNNMVSRTLYYEVVEPKTEADKDY